MSEINLQDLESTVDPVAQPSEADKLEQQLESDLPEKYRGKSVKDIVKMHEEAEKALSRQGRELGEVRHLADTLIGLEQGKKAKESESRTPVTTEELFSDTDEAINRAVEQNPTVQRALTAAEKAEKAENLRVFTGEFPAYSDDLKNPEFIKWVQKSNTRVRLAIDADQHYNLDSARELWNMWGEYKELADTAARIEADKRKDDAKTKREKALADADLEGGVTGDGSSEAVYDRRKVMDLRIKALKGDKDAAARLKKLNPLKVYSEKRIK